VHVILGTIKVRPLHLQEFLQHVRAHAASSIAEPGCVRYDVLQDREDPYTICLYEVFRTEQDLHRHHAQDYYVQWMAMSREWRDPSSYTRRVLTLVNPPDV
jgi:(4S)-4-hydroxy-5-phosphonooxypentane-2,3-dione isomerase